MYVQIRDGKAVELFPDEDPIFPNIPVQERYSPEFLSLCVYVSDDMDVREGYLYDSDTNAFTAPTC